jgi:hypothetical protein
VKSVFFKHARVPFVGAILLYAAVGGPFFVSRAADLPSFAECVGISLEAEENATLIKSIEGLERDIRSYEGQLGNHTLALTDLEQVTMREQLRAARDRLQSAREAQRRIQAVIAANPERRRQAANQAVLGTVAAAVESGRVARPYRISLAWAQNLTGATSAENFLGTVRGLAPVDVLVVDVRNWSRHDLRTARAVKSDFPEPSTVSRNVRIASGLIEKSRTSLDRLVPELEALPRERRPKIVTILSELVIRASDETIARLNRLGEQGMIFVVGSSNLFDPRNPATYSPPALLLRLNSIVVSASAPGGRFKNEMTPGRDVDIFAPAGMKTEGEAPYLAVTTPLLEVQAAGVSSGAMPQAAHAATQVAAMLPGITMNELRMMIRGSSLGPVQWADRTGVQSGGGILNSYRLIRVAERLRSVRDPVRRRALIEDPETYQFPRETAEHFVRGRRLLAQGDHASVEAGIVQLRESFLLQPSPSTAALLGSALRSRGLSVEALFYENYFATYSNALARMIGEGGTIAIRAVNEAARAGELGRKMLMPFVAHPDPEVRQAIRNVLFR